MSHRFSEWCLSMLPEFERRPQWSPVWKWMPCFLKAFWAAAGMSWSSIGMMWSCISTVDFRPKGVVEVCELHTDGSKPMTTIFLGFSGRIIASKDEITTFRRGANWASGVAGPQCTPRFCPRSGFGWGQDLTRVVLIARLPYSALHMRAGDLPLVMVA